jgi:hypothetical protein
MVASAHTNPFYNQAGLNRLGWVGLGLGRLYTQSMVCFFSTFRHDMNASTNLRCVCHGNSLRDINISVSL